MLSVQQVHKAFGDLHAVAGVSFDVRPGEVFGFLGPNGAGKTTTLRMIMGITRPDHGTVTFDGRPQVDRSRVGYLPEERGLFEDASVSDTLTYLGSIRGLSRADARKVGHQWLERLGLADRAKAKVGTLSKGNQQKIQFACAILHKPVLAVLDEPFSGLDPLNQVVFLELIGELRRGGAAVLLSAHQLNLVERMCDRILLISKGRELISGTLDSMRAQAAGGAGEVLSLELRPARGAGGSSPSEAVERLRSSASGAVPRLLGTADGVVRVEVALPSGANLAPVIAALHPSHEVQRVTMRALSLHEIYVRLVGADQAPVEAEAEEARV